MDTIAHAGRIKIDGVENDVFGIEFLLLASTTAVWCVFALLARKSSNQFYGVLGGLLAAAVVGALWQADQLGAFWAFGLKPVLAVWLGSFVLIGLGIGAGWNGQGRLRPALVACGGACFCANTWAGLYFLWMATVAAGGV